MNTPSYMRQLEIFDPDKQQYDIMIFGAGSLGSFIALNLAKLGFRSITVIDYDKVEAHNIPNQFYKVDDIGKFKVDALQEIIKDFTGIRIHKINREIDENTLREIIPVPTLTQLFILTFDNLDSRKIVFNHLKGTNNYLIDARMGGEEYNIITSKMNDNTKIISHQKYYDITPTELRCGQRSVIYSVLAISSEVCNIVKKLNNEEEVAHTIVRNMKKNFILTDKR